MFFAKLNDLKMGAILAYFRLSGCLKEISSVKILLYFTDKCHATNR
ncbi:hypothetical protein JF634_01540 [Simonsiella muelleri]|jgi:hypothetical protein|nr:hypothetical protein [Simonsiella muelleri]UBQ54221.1 hypothetical protein JF634_01540 [Simonsiella muelleri]